MKTSATKTQASQPKLMPTELIDAPAMDNPLAAGLLVVDLNLTAGKQVPTHLLDGVVFDGGILSSPVGLYVEGTAGNDKLYGSSKADTLSGGEGNDRLFGRDGKDTLLGGNGDDWLDGGAGADTIDGGNGFDTLSYESATSGISINLQNGLNSDSDTFSGIERWVGSNYMDIMMGGTGHDDFAGGGGDDWLFGNGGNDLLSGGHGNDKLEGGQGHDILMGGGGNDILIGDSGFVGGESGQASPDTFVFLRGSGLDKILDFQRGLDKIDVSAFGYEPDSFGRDGVLATGWFDENGNLHDMKGMDKHTNTSGPQDKFFYDTRTGILWECEYYYQDNGIGDPGREWLKLYDPIVQVDTSIGLRAQDLIV